MGDNIIFKYFEKKNKKKTKASMNMCCVPNTKHEIILCCMINLLSQKQNIVSFG